MSMRLTLICIFLASAIFSKIAFSAPSVSLIAMNKLGEQVAVLDKDLASYKELASSRLDSQDKRIGDLGLSTAQQANYMGAISNLSTLVGLGITIVSIFSGLAVYLGAKSRAISEARDAARDWFKERSNNLQGQIDTLQNETDGLRAELLTLRKKAADAHLEIDERTTELSHYVIQRRKDIDQAAQTVFDVVRTEDQDSPVSTDPVTISGVRKASVALESKAEIDFTADDHFARGLDDYLATRFDSALIRLDKAIEHAQLESISPDRYVELMLVRARTLGKLDRGEEEISVYDEIESRYGDTAQPLLRRMVARALLNKGVRLGELGHTQQELGAYDEVERRFGSEEQSGLDDLVAKALANKGITLGQLGLSEEAIVVYEKIEQRYGADSNLIVREQVAKSLLNKGARLGKLGRGEAEIAAYEKLQSVYGLDKSASTRERVAKALVNKGIALTRVSRRIDAISIYGQVEATYGEDVRPATREQVVKALWNKGVLLGQLDRFEDQVMVYERLVQSYGEDKSSVTRARVAKVLMSKALRFSALARNDEALKVYEDVLARYSKSKEPDIQILVRRAVARKNAMLEKISDVISAVDADVGDTLVSGQHDSDDAK